MGELSLWAKKTSKFIALEDNETLEAVYQGYKIVSDSRDPEKEKVIYRLGVVIEAQEYVKAFETASGKVARFFDDVKPGTWVRITRHGTAGETTYEISVISGPGATPSEPVVQAKSKEEYPF